MRAHVEQVICGCCRQYVDTLTLAGACSACVAEHLQAEIEDRYADCRFDGGDE